MSLEKVLERLSSDQVSIIQKHLLLRGLDMKIIELEDLKQTKIVNVVKRLCQVGGKTGDLALQLLNKWRLIIETEKTGVQNNDSNVSSGKKTNFVNSTNESTCEEDLTSRTYAVRKLYCRSSKAAKRLNEIEYDSENQAAKKLRAEEDEQINGIPLLEIKNFNFQQLTSFELNFQMKPHETVEFWESLVRRNFKLSIDTKKDEESWKEAYYRFEYDRERKLQMINEKIQGKVMEWNKINKCRIKLIDIPLKTVKVPTKRSNVIVKSAKVINPKRRR